MSQPKLLHISQTLPRPRQAVYIGRPGRWGNPFSHQPHALVRRENVVATKQEAVERYEEWINGQPDLLEQAKRELRGKDLVCWCETPPCHGQVLLAIANSPAGG